MTDQTWSNYLYRLESVKIQPYFLFFLGILWRSSFNEQQHAWHLHLGSAAKVCCPWLLHRGFHPANNNRPLEVRGKNRTPEIVTSSEANKNCNLCFPRFPVECIRMYPMYHMYPFKRFKKKPITNPEPGCKIRPKPSILHRCCCSGWRRHRTCFEASKEILNLNSATGPTPTNFIKF